MQRFYSNTTIQNGIPSGASVSIYTYTGVLATIYAASDPLVDPVTPTSNPLTADTQGNFAFAAPDGQYIAKITKGNFTDTINGIVLASPPLVSPSYTALWPATVPTTQQMVNQRQVCVFDWFTPAQIASVQAQDGLQDLTAAIQAAFTNAPAGCNLVFPRGLYKISGSSNLTRTVSGDITFEQGSVIDATSFTGTSAIAISGSRGTYYVNTVAINAGDVSVTVNATLAATLKLGDILILSTDNVSYGGDGTLWYGGRNYYYKGELLEVRNVVGSTVYVKDPVRDSYGASSASAARLNAVQTKVSGLTIIGSNTITPEQDGLLIKWGKNCEVDGGETDGFAHAGLTIDHVLGFKAVKFVTDAKYQASVGTGYGICINSSQTVSISDCRLVGQRCGLTSGGNEPCRDIMVVNCFLDSDGITYDGCIDTHGNTENCIISNCTLNNGTALSGKGDVVDSCTIYTRGWGCQYVSDWQGTHTAEGFTTGCTLKFSNNQIFSPDGSTSTSTFILQPSGTIDLVTYYNNKVITGTGTSTCWFYLNTRTGSAATGTVTECQFDDNKCVGTNTSQHGIDIVSPINLTNLRVRRNTFTVPAGNMVMYGSALALSVNIDILDNLFTSNQATSHTMTLAPSGATTIRYNRNTYTNTLAFSYYEMTFTASAYIEIVGNTHRNATSSTHPAFIAVAPQILYRDNNRINITVADTLTGRVYHTVTPTGNVIGQGSAMPTTGSWTIGDIWQNSAPTNAAGQVGYWLRVTTGSGNVLNTDWRAAGVTQ